MVPDVNDLHAPIRLHETSMGRINCRPGQRLGRGQSRRATSYAHTANACESGACAQSKFGCLTCAHGGSRLRRIDSRSPSPRAQRKRKIRPSLTRSRGGLTKNETAARSVDLCRRQGLCGQTSPCRYRAKRRLQCDRVRMRAHDKPNGGAVGAPRY
jgi:hypothetical protein